MRNPADVLPILSQQYVFDARGIARRFRHAAIFGALDALPRDELNVELQALWQRTRKTALFVTHSITEAVFLSTRVVVFSPRPGKIVEDMVLDLPAERKLAIRETPEFARYTQHIRGLFETMGLIHD